MLCGNFREILSSRRNEEFHPSPPPSAPPPRKHEVVKLAFTYTCSGSTDWSIRRDPIVDFVHSTRVRQKQRYFRGYSRRFARCNFLSFPTYSTRRFKIQTVSRRFIARGKCNVHASVDGLDLSSSPLESPLGHLIKTVEYPCEIRKTDIRVTSLPLGFLQGERKKRGGGGEGGGIDENVDRFALQRDVGCGGRFSS